MLELPEEPSVTPRRRSRRTRGIVVAVVAVVVVGGLAAYASLALLAPAPLVSATAENPEVAAADPVAFAVPYTGSSAISVTGAEQFPGTVGIDGILVSGGGNGALPIASITKLVTALVMLDVHPLAAGEDGPTLTFSEADADLYDEYYVMGATIQPMKAGSRMSQHDVLEMMLVVSATNYADAATGWAFGSNRAFRAATATWLSAHGLADTTIVEPTGVDPGNTSTTSDLIALGRIALATPVIAEIVGYPALDVAGFDRLPNTNTLLGEHGVTGLKTGTSDEAGACLLFSASIDVGLAAPITIVGAVLGGGYRSAVADEVVRLLDSVTAGFHRVTLVQRGDELGSYTTPWGDDAVVVAAESASLLTWSDLPITARVDLDTVTTAQDGARVGTATYVAGDETVTVPLELDGAISPPDDWWRLTHPAELF